MSMVTCMILITYVKYGVAKVVMTTIVTVFTSGKLEQPLHVIHGKQLPTASVAKRSNKKLTPDILQKDNRGLC